MILIFHVIYVDVGDNMYLWIALSIALVTWGIVKNQSKSASFVILIFLFVIFAFNRGTYDYNNYVYQYYEIQNGLNQGAYEIIYTAIMRVSAIIGLDYASFKILISLFQLSILYCCIKNITNNVTFVLALYMIFPAYLDCFHTRFFMGSFIVIIALLRYMTNETTGKHYVKATVVYLIAIICASLIHSSLLFFAVIPVISILKGRSVNDVKIYCGIIIVIFLTLLVLRYTGQLSWIIASFNIEGSEQRLLSYGIYGATGLSVVGIKIVVVYFIRQSIRLLFSYYLLNVFRKESIEKYAVVAKGVSAEKSTSMTLKQQYMELLLFVNIIAFLIIIFQTYTVNFERLYRIINLLNYIGAAITISNLRMYSRKRAAVKSISFVYALFFAMDYFLQSDFYIEAYKLVFTNNVVFNAIFR